MRTISCAICNSPEGELVYESTVQTRSEDAQLDPYSGHYRINRCTTCRLLYSSPILDAEALNQLYTAAPHGNIVDGEEQNVRKTMQLYYARARPFLQARQRMLDIGCDVGYMLDAAKQDGFAELHGIEPVLSAARVAQAIPGAVISTDFYEEHVFPDTYFDLITLIHVVDHLVEPKRVLDRAWAQLKPGGVALAVVHNAGSFLAKVLGERFPPYNMYHHYFFTAQTLSAVFERSAFEVLRVGGTPNCYSLDFLVRKVPGLPRPVVETSRAVLREFNLANRSATVPLGNLGIVVRRPLTS